MKRVLITGANGFVGKHLLKVALSNQFEVIAGVRPTSNIEDIEQMDVEILRLNYQSKQSLQKQLTESDPFDFVIHNAGVTEAIDLVSYRKGNVEVTRNLIESLEESHTKAHFIYVSSLAARGPNFQGKDSPISDYGKSKLEAEVLVKEAKLSYLIIRPTAVYGSGDKAFLELVQMMAKGISLSIGDRAQQLTFIHGHDLARFVVHFHKSSNETFEVTDGKVYSQKELLTTIKKHIGKRFVLKIHIGSAIVKSISYSINWFYNKILKKSWLYNPSKIQELLATDWTVRPQSNGSEEFLPIHTIESGFEEAIADYKQRGWI